MTNTNNSNNNKRNPFSKVAKHQLPVGGEITSSGLTWRKLSDGTGAWYCDFQRNGHRYKRLLGHERDNVTLSAARDRLLQIRVAAAKGFGGQEAPGRAIRAQSFAAVAEEYMRQRGQSSAHMRQEKCRMRNIVAYLGERRLEHITPADVEAFKSNLVGIGRRPSTVNSYLVLISRVFEHARKHDVEFRNPVRGIRPPKQDIVEKTTYSDKEIRALLEAAGDRLDVLCMVALGAFAGLRASEVLGLCWKHVNLIDGYLDVRQVAVEGTLRPTTKNGHRRYIPLTPNLKRVLVDYRRAVQGDGLLFSRDGRAPLYHVQHIFRRLKKRAGLSAHSGGFHALRHSFITKAAKQGVDLPTIQRLAGHQNIKVTMNYIHLGESHLRKMMQLIEQ